MSVLATSESGAAAQSLGTIQISDFFGAYPDISPRVPTTDSLFNTLISRKQEFAELRPGISEPSPARGQAFKHQKLAVRYLTWYDRLLLLHDPGTGKSCIITHSAELFKNEFLKSPDDPTKIRRAVILVRGPPLAENIKNEIVCRCTDRVYETDLVMRSTDERVMKSNITRELKTWYDIMTYHEFATIIDRFEREEDLEEYMSNKAIYVDEAHNVPTLEDIRNPQPPILTIAEARAATAREVQRVQEAAARAIERGRRPRPIPARVRGESVYQTLFRAFHKGKRNKIVLATATPMINAPNDIVPLMNLILPLDFQMPYAPLGEAEQVAFANQPLEAFEPYFRGRVSYVRALETGAIDQPMGIQLPGWNTSVYTCAMSAFQYQAYLRGSVQQPGQSLESFYFNQRQASNFVFPDGTFGTEAFNRYIEKIGDQYRFKQTPEAQQCQALISIPRTLELLSKKYADIVEICRSSFPEAEVVHDDEKGIVFVYFSDFVHGSGAVLLSLCLQAHGYEEFRETQSIFIGSQEAGIGPSFGPCSSTTEPGFERRTRSGFGKRPRYAVLSSGTPPARIPAILNTLSSYENRYGQYLQVLIGSQTSREGINIYNAVKMILASSSWNHSTNFQARERVFRSTSHEVRLREKRARLARQGLPIDNVTIDVQTFNMASVYEYDAERLQDDLRLVPWLAAEVQRDPALAQALQTDNYDTIDPQMYVRAEQKDRLIRKIMRYMKQSSLDCYINYNRNVRPTDVDGSPVCDYMQCAYDCAGIRRELLEPLDRTTKVLYYSDEEVQQAQMAILRIFSRFHSLKIDQLHQLIHQVDPNLEDIFIDMAIEKTIRENSRFLDSSGQEHRLLDRMGFPAYLRESLDGVLYLEKDPFEIRPRPENTAYSSTLIGTQDPNNNSFLDYVVGREVVNETPIIQQLINTPTDDPQFMTLLGSLSIVSKVNLLETALIERTRTGESSEFYDTIISAFNHAVFSMPEPINLLIKTSNLLANRGKTRGRKPNPNTQPKLKRLEFGPELQIPLYDPSQMGERVYLHTLLNQGSHARTSYSATTRYFNVEGQIRILKMSEGIGWRDVNDYEYVVYNDLIKRQINEIRAYYEQFPIYGIMLPPKNEFRLRDREREGPAAARDARSIYDGRVCHTWRKPELIDILYRLGIRLPPPPPTITRSMMIASLESKNVFFQWDQVPDDRLVHFYSWYQTNYSRTDICDLIRRFFERTGRLLTGRRPTAPVSGASPATESIQVAPALTTPDYSEPFTLPASTAMPQLPSQVMPQFAMSAGQPVTQFNTAPLIPTGQLLEIPRSQADVSQALPVPSFPVAAPRDLSSNVGPGVAMGQVPPAGQGLDG